ncbi:MAG: hypothetical protein QM813_03235 [Verrucomicrobiota bacterium]
MLGFPLLQQVSGVAFTVLVLINLLVTVVANEHQIAHVIQGRRLSREDAPTSWTIFRERVDVRHFGQVDRFLSYRRFVEQSVAVVELASRGGAPPQFTFNFALDGASQLEWLIIGGAHELLRSSATGLQYA